MKADKSLNEFIVVYSSRNMAICLYQSLIKKSYRVELVPTPRKVFSGCSESLKFQYKDMEAVMDEIKKISKQPQGIYEIIRNGHIKEYKKI